MNSLYGTAVTGMHGADFALDVIANNISNLNTSGFQAVEASLASLPSQAEIGDPNNGIPVPASTHVGMGVQPAGTMRSQAQAMMEATGNPLDLALNSGNFFALREPSGAVVYTPQVSLHLEPDGQVTSAQGLVLNPPVSVPGGVTHVFADSTGTISYLGPSGKAVGVAKLSVVSFSAPENLRGLGNGLYSETLGSGRPQTAGSTAQVWSGYQLKSTVDLSTEMVNMIQAQRMYEMNTKALQTMDALVNNVVSMQPR